MEKFYKKPICLNGSTLPSRRVTRLDGLTRAGYWDRVNAWRDLTGEGLTLCSGLEPIRACVNRPVIKISQNYRTFIKREQSSRVIVKIIINFLHPVAKATIFFLKVQISTSTLAILLNYHSKKYQNFPIVLGWKFKGNGQVSTGNLRETEISISHWGNYWKWVRFPKISPTKYVVKFHNCLQYSKVVSIFSRKKFQNKLELK